MGGKAKFAAVALAAAACAAVWAAELSPPRGDDHDAIIRALLRRDRSLGSVHFQVPLGLYRQYLQDEHTSSLPPVPFLPTCALYTLEVTRRDVALRADLELRVLDAACPAIGVLGDVEEGWEELTING